MNEKTDSVFCYQLHCKEPQIPFYTALFSFLMGFLGAFLYELLLTDLFVNGNYLNLCIFGIHFHHLYIGILISIGLFLYIIIGTPHKKNAMVFIIILLFLGLAIGLILTDVLTHFIFVIVPFTVYCQ